ncbi:MAG: lysophospholipase [Candidatus Caenarcaniphilales bacterium]|nr:lysophospholipase [Candidatus Caenarcaniphilales bacterium]
METIVLALHGLGGRAAWFDNLRKELESDQLKFYASDLQGFGNNEPRGHINSYKQWLRQVEAEYLELKDKYPSSQFVLLGHSLGAVILSNLIIDPEDKLIFSVPGFKGAKATFSLAFTINTICKLIEDRLIKHEDRLIRLPSSKDEPDITDEDPLKVYEVSPNLLWQILMMSQNLEKKLSIFSNPLLLIQVKNDQVVSNEVMDQMLAVMPSTEKNVIELINTEHDWIWDPRAVHQAVPGIKDFLA